MEGGVLALKDGLTGDTRLHRDHFTRARGFDVSYGNQRPFKARYSAGQVSELHSNWHKDRVQIVPLLDAAAMLEQAEQTLQAQDAEIHQLEQRINHYRRDDTSLRLAIACLIVFMVFQVGLLIRIATH